MQLSQSLRLKQKQSMVMTPRLQQAIRMLQMNNLDLQTYLETEALENPFMEVQQADTNNDTLPSIQEDSEAEAFNGAASDTGLDRAIQDGTAMVEDKTPATAENVQETNQYESAEFDFESRLNSQMSTMSQAAENDWDMISTRISERAISLVAHVEKQIELSQMSESQKILAYVLASHIEPSGWLGKPLEDIAEEKGLDIDDLMPILQNLQSLEPTGIFARDLKECLRLQALEEKKITPQFEVFLNHLELLAHGKLDVLQRKCKCTETELRDMLDTVRSFDPKPGMKFDDSNEIIHAPDLVVFKKDGNWVVDLNRSTLPGIVIDEKYAEELNRKIKEKEALEFSANALSSARWLKRAMEQRNNTTLIISAEIIKQQTDFLDKGPTHLKPLLLRDVAKAVSMHESTVSRVTSGIMIETPIGCFPLKSFFSVSLNSQSDSTENASAAAVRNKIQELVNQETPSDPLSDDAIAEIISKQGVSLARRTVAKYRQLLKIPSSTERRRRAKISNLG